LKYVYEINQKIQFSLTTIKSCLNQKRISSLRLKSIKKEMQRSDNYRFVIRPFNSYDHRLAPCEDWINILIEDNTRNIEILLENILHLIFSILHFKIKAVLLKIYNSLRHNRILFSLTTLTSLIVFWGIINQNLSITLLVIGTLLSIFPILIKLRFTLLTKFTEWYSSKPINRPFLYYLLKPFLIRRFNRINDEYFERKDLSINFHEFVIKTTHTEIFLNSSILNILIAIGIILVFISSIINYSP